ncbi:twin transmembrane helix small protein [Rhodobacterales bacterium HKCCE2091]|nr:twin transmembrane helix small protein [Rhodobacterales bacterium HKCCE2091]
MPASTIVLIACLAVVVVLALGINAFRRGGEYNRNNANKLMRWRLGLQALAVLVILLVVWLRGSGGS